MNSKLEEKVSQRTHELLESKQELEKNLHIRTHFLENITHEVRTPITGISGALQLLKIKHIPEELAPLINIVSTEINRINHFQKSD